MADSMTQLAHPATAHRGTTIARLLLQGAALGALIFVALVALFPIFLMLSGSLQTIQELYRGTTLWPAIPQFQNYAMAWSAGSMAVFIPNSILYTVIAVSGCSSPRAWPDTRWPGWTSPGGMWSCSSSSRS